MVERLELAKVEIWLLGIIITHSQLSCLDGVEMLQMKGPHFSIYIALQVRVIMREPDA